MKRYFSAVVGRLKERFDVRQTWKNLAAAGKKHGKWLFLLLLATEIVESVVAPAVLMLCGWAELAPIPLLIHTEPLVVFVYVAIRKWFVA